MKQKTNSVPNYTAEELDKMIADIDRDIEKLSENQLPNKKAIVEKWNRTKHKLMHLKELAEKQN